MDDENKIANGICNCDNGKIRHKPNQSHSEFVTLLLVTLLQTTLSMFFVMLYLIIKLLIFILLIRYIISASGDFYQ